MMSSRSPSSGEFILTDKNDEWLCRMCMCPAIAVLNIVLVQIALLWLDGTKDNNEPEFVD